MHGLALVLLTVGAVPGPPRSCAGNDSAAVVRLEHEWLAARDSATLDRILASDFVHVTPGGHFLSKRAHVEWTVAHPRPQNAWFARLDIRVFGNAAVATGVVARPGPVDRTKRSAFTDVFVCRDGRWQAVSAEETAVAP